MFYIICYIKNLEEYFELKCISKHNYFKGFPGLISPNYKTQNSNRHC